MSLFVSRRSDRLPLSRPELGDAEIDEVVQCLRSGWITTGPLTARFEKEFASAVGASVATAFSSCTAALHVAYLALGIGRGDEVVIPALTWPAAANMAVACGATPVFADIDPRTWNIDPRSIAERLTTRTRAVVPVHFAGQPADLDAIRCVLTEAGRPDIAVIEDAAHAIGASYKGVPVGAVGEAGTTAACFSFHPIKNMTTGEGGMATCHDDALARRMRLWRFHGVERESWQVYTDSARTSSSYDVVVPGFKYNMMDVQAALGLHQLARVSAFNERRRALAARYLDALRGMPEITPPGAAEYDCVHAWHLMTVLVEDRAPFVNGLHERGINTGLHFEPVHLHTFYRRTFGWSEGACPVAEQVSRRIVSLPLFPSMAAADVDDVVEAIGQVLHAA